jgi:transglutaminase-like putative cysteine protease
VVRNTGLQQGARQIESRDEPLVVGAGATHAWLHVYLPGAGWVPYDPTNSLVGGTDLIRVAFTRKPEQAAPVSGSWFGAAQDFIGIAGLHRHGRQRQRAANRAPGRGGTRRRTFIAEPIGCRVVIVQQVL